MYMLIKGLQRSAMHLYANKGLSLKIPPQKTTYSTVTIPAITHSQSLASPRN
jgi:hypothetical protein